MLVKITPQKAGPKGYLGGENHPEHHKWLLQVINAPNRKLPLTYSQLKTKFEKRFKDTLKWSIIPDSTFRDFLDRNDISLVSASLTSALTDEQIRMRLEFAKRQHGGDKLVLRRLIFADGTWATRNATCGYRSVSPDLNAAEARAQHLFRTNDPISLTNLFHTLSWPRELCRAIWTLVQSARGLFSSRLPYAGRCRMSVP